MLVNIPFTLNETMTIRWNDKDRFHERTGAIPKITDVGGKRLDI